MNVLRLALIGDPVAHSASPRLFREFFGMAGVAGTYDALTVRAGEAAAAIVALRAQGYAGLNVTTPLKEEAFARARTRDAAAVASGAVNTLVFGATVRGYNTDGIGALGALADAGLRDFGAARVLVLGAGPTARAIVAALHERAASVFVWNRTASSAESLAERFDVELWRPGEEVDAAFAAVPPGVTFGDDALRVALRRTSLVVDANYGPRATLAAALGRSDVHDGERMLRAGAAAAFELFRRVDR